MTAVSTAASRKRMTAVDRRAQILTIAEELFAEHGFQDVTMDQVAAHAGVTKPVIYGHFDSKDGLLLAIIGRVRGDILASMAGAVEGLTDPAEMLHAGLLDFFRFVDHNNAAWRLLNRDAGKITGAPAAEIAALRQAQADLTTELILRAITRATPEEAEAFAEVIIGACDALANWRDGSPSVTADAAARHAMTALWNGLGSRA